MCVSLKSLFPMEIASVLSPGTRPQGPWDDPEPGLHLLQEHKPLMLCQGSRANERGGRVLPLSDTGDYFISSGTCTVEALLRDHK